MIHLCTCIGGSTSTFSSRKRRGGTTVSCKNCGGRPAIDGKSSSSCLLNTVLELTSLINSDFTWTKISKGCRSSSRRPRRSTSNTIDLACGKLLSKDSTDLEMPVSESEKLGVSVLERHFSEKAEHIPIKKRRFLFRPSSPTHNITTNTPLERTERHETSPKSNLNANSLSVTSGAFTQTCESGSKDHKLDPNKLVKDDDFSGISILAAAACSNSLGAETDRCEGSVNHAVPKNVEFNENNVKKEPDSHTSTTTCKVEESTLNSSSHAPLELAFSKTNQEPNIQKSPASDVRFSWDLNTVMDAWEEPLANEHEISASDAANDNATTVEEKKNYYTKDNSSGDLPVELENFSHENKELKIEKCEPLSHVFEIAQNAVAVKTEFMHDKHTDGASDDIPVTRTLAIENPTHGTLSKWADLSGQNSGGFSSIQAVVDTKLSMDCSIPPGFDNCFNLRACKENVSPTTKHELSLNTATCMENGPHQSGATSDKVDDEDMTKMGLASNVVAMDDMVSKEETEQPAAVSSMHDAAYSDADNGFGYDNFQSDNRAGSGINKVDEGLVGYDSQYEDGELRESTINAWKGYGLTEGQKEYDTNKISDGLDPSIVDANETNSQNVKENAHAIKESTEVASGKEADLASMVLPEKLHSSDEALSASEPNEMISCREKSGRQDNVQQHAASQSDEWKMNVSGWDRLPDNQRMNSNNFTKTRNFTARKFSYREEQKDRFDTENVEMKAEGSRCYRKESLTRMGGPSTRDVFVSRGRFQMERCSPKDGDGLTSRPERESGALKSFGRGRYSPHNRPSGRGIGLWNRSPERIREGGLSFHRSILENSGAMDNMTNEGGMDLSDTRRHNTSYVNRRPFRSRSPTDQEVIEYRARLGLRPTEDTGHDRFVSLSRGRGRGRSMRYSTRLDGEGSRGRYHGPANDGCDEFMTDYSHPFPRSRRCFSPVERRGNNNSYQHHQSDSRSPSRPRTRSPVGNSRFRRRSRSPGFRPDGRIRRPRSPTYRDPSEYNSGPRNSNLSPPRSRWVNYKERPVFDRSSPTGRADGPHGERFSFYDSSRKPKHNEYYRSGHPGRFSDINESGRGRPRYAGSDGDRPNNGYRRGGFVRRYNMDGPAKRFQYDDDGFGLGFDDRDRHALEIHARSNPNLNTKPCNDGTDSRFRDFPRRQREDGGDFKRRSREGKDSKEESERLTNDLERRPKEVKDQSTTSSTTNLDSMIPNDVKECDNKPISGSN